MILKKTCSRREMLGLAGKMTLAGVLSPRLGFAKVENASNPFGVIVGDAGAARAAEQILRDGGNAFDAAVAAAFAAGITSPQNSGIGGYGGHAMIARADGIISSIDFNSAAPAAAREDMYAPGPDGKVKGNANVIGWLAAGVPGIPAGLSLVLEKYGTRSLRDVMAPAIRLCESGARIITVKGIHSHPIAG